MNLAPDRDVIACVNDVLMMPEIKIKSPAADVAAEPALILRHIIELVD